MIRKTSSALLVLTITLQSSMTEGYERETHRSLTVSAARNSILASESRITRLGLRHSIDLPHPNQIYTDSKGVGRSIINLLAWGSDYEDDTPPGPIYHFFDPRSGLPLVLNVSDYDPKVQDVARTINTLADTSPNRALSVAGTAGESNPYGLSNLRRSMYASLISTKGGVRSASRAELFEGLGRVLHHIEDMAQPQHVRNDAHISSDSFARGCAIPVLDWSIICSGYRLLERASAYETYTELRARAGLLSASGYGPVYPDKQSVPDGASLLGDPKRFWTNDGKGMADYSSRNFFTTGTMLQHPPYAGSPTRLSIRTLCETANPPCGPDVQLWPVDEFMTFFPTQVDDQLRGLIETNEYAQVMSLFDPELTTYVGRTIASVNRFTYARDNELLLPRAVGYAAGFINWFFRGDMEARLPLEGTYGIADTSSACTDPCGFGKIKLLLRNVTYKDDIGAGTLTAIARYFVNRCYSRDLAGDYGGPSFLGLDCRLPAEAVTVSAPLTITSLPRAFGAAFEFVFPKGWPIPLNATDLDIQIVFRGQLGSEADAVAVTTLDVAEPQYFAVANVTDYAFDTRNGADRWIPVVSNGPGAKTTIKNLTVAFADPAIVPTPVATMPSLGPGQHAQFAFLTGSREEQPDYHFWARVGSDTAGFGYLPEDNIAVGTEEFRFYEGQPTSVYRRTCPVYLERGMYRQIFRYFGQTVHAGSMKMAVLGGSRRAGADGANEKSDPVLCYEPPAPGSGGFWDLSGMTPLFTPQTSVPWILAF